MYGTCISCICTYPLEGPDQTEPMHQPRTAASFFANLASVLRALREFGFFMGLCPLDCLDDLSTQSFRQPLVEDYSLSVHLQK